MKIRFIRATEPFDVMVADVNGVSFILIEPQPGLRVGFPVSYLPALVDFVEKAIGRPEGTTLH